MKSTIYSVEHLGPIWFIPVVGNLLVPIVGVNFFHQEAMWFFFSVGTIFWLNLMVMIIYRIFFHEPLAEKIISTLFILIAPPAVAALSYAKLTGSIGEFGRISYYFSLFLAVLLLVNIRSFVAKKFYLSQWALTFPLAAVATASALMYHTVHLTAFRYFYTFFLFLAAFFVVILFYRTARAVIKKEICVQEEH